MAQVCAVYRKLNRIHRLKVSIPKQEYINIPPQNKSILISNKTIKPIK